MENEISTTIISGPALIFVWVYLGLLIVIGLMGRYARKEETMSDFFLGGRQMGFFVLLMTLYATQYSGNTLIGFSGSAYRQGFYFLVSVGFMMGVIGLWMLYGPKLQKLSKKYKFITPGDFIQYRFGLRPLTTFATILCVIALCNYMLTNLKAVGIIMETASGGAVDPVAAIIIASFIMVVYETLGGMRSVAWTDVIQGLMLLAGCLAIIWGVYQFYGGLPSAAEYLMQNREDLWTPPTPEQKRIWLSTLVMMSIGISLYPHAIQRIYAAKDAVTLRRSFQVMVFMPLITTFLILIVGLVGAAQFPGLEKSDSDNISILVLADLALKAPWFRMVAILFICAAIAAIMSTVDSALLAVSAMVSQDLYKPLKPNASQHDLLLVGKISSWVVIALGAYLAIILKDTIWRLIEIKLEILCQIAPAMILGLYVKNLNKYAVLCGMIAGTILVVLMMFGESYLGLPISTKPWNIHAGIWGLALNLLVISLFQLVSRSPGPDSEK
jgi:SSS family solute:Na+ symporter